MLPQGPRSSILWHTPLAQLVIHLHHLRTETMGMPANMELDKEAAEEIIRAVGRRV